jgi:hypothetical protein
MSNQKLTVSNGPLPQALLPAGTGLAPIPFKGDQP